MVTDQAAVFHIEQKRMFRPCDHRLRLGQLSDGDLPGAAIAEEIGGAQRPRFVAMGKLRPGKKPRFAGKIERRCHLGIAAQKLFVAVLPQPQRGMAGQGKIGTGFLFEDQPVVGQEPAASGSESSGKSGFSGPRFGKKSNGFVADFDRAAMKHQLAEHAKGQWLDLVEEKVIDSRLRDARHRVAGYLLSIRRQREIRELGEAEKEARSCPVEIQPLCAIGK